MNANEYPEPQLLQHSIAVICFAALVVACGATEPSRSTPKAKTSATPGWLNVTTTPAGVGVLVDGNYVGTSPLKVRLTSGDHIIVFQHQGRNEGPFVVSVTPGQTRHMKHRFLATLGGGSKPRKVSTVPHLYGNDTYPCTGHGVCSEGSPADGTLYTTGVRPEFIDPGLLSEMEGYFLADNLFEGLVKKGPDGAPLPGVAKSWTTSANGRVWTFQLRSGANAARWSNGRVVTAHDFVYSWLRKMSPKLASVRADLLSKYIHNGKAWSQRKLRDPNKVGLKALGDHTLQVTLVGPTPFFMEYLKSAHYAPVPREAVEKHGKRWTQVGNIVSNGAYTLQQHAPRGDTVLVRNASYWNLAKVRIPKVHIYHTDTWRTAWKLYRNGQVQWIRTPLPPERVFTLITQKRPDLLIDEYLCYYYYAFRMDKAPFDNAKVRRAFNMAIDKRRLVDRVTRLKQTPATGPVPTVTASGKGYTPPKGDAFDPDKARKLLAEAGYPKGKGLGRITLTYNTFKWHRRIAEFVQKQLNDHLGVQITLENMEWKGLLKKVTAGNFQMCRFGWCGVDDPYAFLAPFRSKSPKNYTGYKSPAFDKLLDRSLSAPAARRMTLLAQAEKLLQQATPIAPLYHYTRAYLKVPVLRGFKPDPSNTHRIEYMYWGDKTYPH